MNFIKKEANSFAIVGLFTLLLILALYFQLLATLPTVRGEKEFAQLLMHPFSYYGKELLSRVLFPITILVLLVTVQYTSTQENIRLTAERIYGIMQLRKVLLLFTLEGLYFIIGVVPFLGRGNFDFAFVFFLQVLLNILYLCVWLNVINSLELIFLNKTVVYTLLSVVYACFSLWLTKAERIGSKMAILVDYVDDDLVNYSVLAGFLPIFLILLFLNIVFFVGNSFLLRRMDYVES